MMASMSAICSDHFPTVRVLEDLIENENNKINNREKSHQCSQKLKIFARMIVKYHKPGGMDG